MTDSATRYSVNRRRFLRDATLTSLGLIAAACAPSSTGAPSGGGGGAKGGEFHGGWPYVLAPQGHWNYFATNAILGGGI
jgi:peptide/nickel transport system substrate-binding protein